MSLTINTNPAAANAGFHLSRNSQSLQQSINRLSSGKRINRPSDDSGGLAVSMKLESAITRLNGAQKNVQNATSFLEVQDGILSAAGKILNRMIELKGLSDDVMKNSSDTGNYNREFQDLQQQIYDMSALKFNGVSMFAQFSSETNNDEGVFNDTALDNTVSVYVSADGSTGPKVSVNKALLLSALTIDAGTLAAGAFSTAGTGDVKSFASANAGTRINLSDVSVGVFTQAIQNIATLRADNGASMSRLRFAGEEMGMQETNLIAAKGRITDVDIAAESTRLAKYNILVQASASMLAQANSSSDVALMLLR